MSDRAIEKEHWNWTKTWYNEEYYKMMKRNLNDGKK